MSRVSRRNGTKTIGGSRQAARRANYLKWKNRYNK